MIKLIRLTRRTIGFSSILLVSCLSMESFYFMNKSVDVYFQSQDMAEYERFRDLIPDELIVADSFQIDEDWMYGFWALQPSDTIEDVEDGFDSTVITVMYSHGNSHNINRYWDRVELLWELGYRVYIYDYPGFGRSEGEPTSAACFSCAGEALESVMDFDLTNISRLVYYGYSLGGYVAVYLAAEEWSPPGLVIESSPASTDALLKDSGLLGLPSGIVSADDFNNEERIAEIDCPLLIMHGRIDDYITFDHNAMVLWDLAAQPKDSLWVADAGHDDLPYVAGDDYGEKLEEFITNYLGL
jgi:pimeloyl-ACP methyl ester carboxylesterase